MYIECSFCGDGGGICKESSSLAKVCIVMKIMSGIVMQTQQEKQFSTIRMNTNICATVPSEGSSLELFVELPFFTSFSILFSLHGFLKWFRMDESFDILFILLVLCPVIFNYSFFHFQVARDSIQLPCTELTHSLTWLYYVPNFYIVS